MKKLLAIILCFAMLVCMLASCNSGNGGDTTTGSDTTPGGNTDQGQTNVSYPVEVFYTHEIIETKETTPIANVSSANFSVKTDKKPFEYKVGEDILFTITLMSGAKTVSCEKFHVTIKYDGVEQIEDFYISGETGKFELTTQVAQPGFVMINVEACDDNRKAYSKADVLCGGAGAQIDELVPTTQEPSDFDAYWSEQIAADVLAISPDIIQLDKYNSDSNHDYYYVKIRAVDDGAIYAAKGYTDRHDYVSGILVIPKNAAANSCKMVLDFDGHGVYTASVSKYLIDKNTIYFKAIAHSIDANVTSAQISSYKSSVLNAYGLNYKKAKSPDEIYYRNMVLRDLQAARFMKEYFGEGGEMAGLWNGTDFHLNGGSQGGFQTAAVAALAEQVGVNITYAKISRPWLCDIAGYCTDNVTLIDSKFWPEGDPDVLSYFDSVFFARRIKCKTDVTVCLGDDTTTPTSVTKLYMALNCEKSFAITQNGDHGGAKQVSKDYKYN